MNLWMIPNMKRYVTFLVTSVVLLGGAHAASYNFVVADKSSITFQFKQMGVTADGRFKKFNAQVEVDTDKLAQANANIDIDLASIDTGSKEADQEAVGKAWFNAAAHPRATFVLKSLTSAGAGQFEALGQLTIKGQTREVRAPARLSPQGLLTGSFVMKRADFGIGEGMWAKFDVVANEITVKFSLSLK
jgi:polyisoprenoid-binding protein YceI